MCTTVISKFNSGIQPHSAEKNRTFYTYMKEAAHLQTVFCMFNMKPHSSGYANGKNNEMKGRRCIPYFNTLDDERKEISVVLCE